MTIHEFTPGYGRYPTQRHIDYLIEYGLSMGTQPTNIEIRQMVGRAVSSLDYDELFPLLDAIQDIKAKRPKPP